LEWAEVDLDKGLWTIPAAKMKRTVHGKVNGRPHLVPLAKRAVTILRDLHPLSGHGRYVFPSLLKLRGWGIEAEASPQATRGVMRRSLRGWGVSQVPPSELARSGASTSSGPQRGLRARARSRPGPEITKELASSPDPADRKLSKSIVAFVMQTEVAQAVQRMRDAQRQTELPGMSMDRTRTAQRCRRSATEAWT
jgi:hypothetical protein